MARLYHDPFTQWLEREQISVSAYQPAAMFGAPPVGWQITVGRSTLVYRVPEEDPGLLIIVLFERQVTRKGLQSPFADIVRFLALVKKSAVGVVRVQGHVSAVSWRPEDSLENTQIGEFYRRYLGVEDLGVENGVEWVGGSLTTYIPPLATDRRWLDAPPAPPTTD